ncbi:MAG: hypothetical protein ACEQR8_02385 [Cypionkella sp.]
MEAFVKPLQNTSRYGEITVGKAFIEGPTVVMPIRHKGDWVGTTSADLDKFADLITSSMCRPEMVKALTDGRFSLTLRLLKAKTTFYERAVDAASCRRAMEVKYRGSVEASSTPIPGNETLPLFSFKGVEATRPVDFTTLGRCFDTDGGTTSCFASDDQVAGESASVIYRFRGGQLSQMRFSFPDFSAAKIREALEARYGPPCQSEDREWQNKMGATFSNPTFTWCFRTGVLRFETRGEKVDEGRVVYADTNQADPTPPKVDF